MTLAPIGRPHVRVIHPPFDWAQQVPELRPVTTLADHLVEQHRRRQAQHP